ncbi:RuvB-like protein 2 [Candidozyma auris]|nr:RuvB-like protein 2 [[Candida] auris]
MEGRRQGRDRARCVVHRRSAHARYREFSFINRALEDDFAPIVVMATNRGVSQTRGTNYKSPHGVPMDLLDRSIIIHTSNYSADELRTILSIRANEEEAELHADALALLTKIGEETSLRYAANLIAVAQQIASKRRSATVELPDVKRAYMLFLDSERSVQFVNDNSKSFIDDEGNVTLSSNGVKSDAKDDDKMQTD